MKRFQRLSQFYLIKYGHTIICIIFVIFQVGDVEGGATSLPLVANGGHCHRINAWTLTQSSHSLLIKTKVLFAVHIYSLTMG